MGKKKISDNVHLALAKKATTDYKGEKNLICIVKKKVAVVWLQLGEFQVPSSFLYILLNC